MKICYTRTVFLFAIKEKIGLNGGNNLTVEDFKKIEKAENVLLEN